MVPTGSCNHILTHFGANALGKTQRPAAPTPSSVSLISPSPQSWLFSGRPVIFSSRNMSHMLLQMPGKLLALHLLGYSSAPFKCQLVSILQGREPSLTPLPLESRSISHVICSPGTLHTYLCCSYITLCWCCLINVCTGAETTSASAHDHVPMSCTVPGT